jgi:hypothetical protein
MRSIAYIRVVARCVVATPIGARPRIARQRHGAELSGRTITVDGATGLSLALALSLSLTLSFAFTFALATDALAIAVVTDLAAVAVAVLGALDALAVDAHVIAIAIVVAPALLARA